MADPTQAARPPHGFRCIGQFHGKSGGVGTDIKLISPVSRRIVPSGCSRSLTTCTCPLGGGIHFDPREASVSAQRIWMGFATAVRLHDGGHPTAHLTSTIRIPGHPCSRFMGLLYGGVPALPDRNRSTAHLSRQHRPSCAHRTESRMVMP